MTERLSHEESVKKAPGDTSTGRNADEALKAMGLK
jgi:hypothetical protein